MKITFKSKYVKFVFIMNLIQAVSLAILYLLAKYPIPASLGSIVMTTCLLCVLDILLYERVCHMTKVVTGALGMSKECSPYAEILLAKYPNLTKFIAVAIILLAYGFILTILSYACEECGRRWENAGDGHGIRAVQV